MTPGPSLSLALRVEGGQLFAMLTDFQLLSVQGRCPLPPGPGDDGPAGRPLAATLPAEVAAALDAVGQGSLTVQLTPELIHLTLEELTCADGHRLGERLAVVRQLAVPGAPLRPPPDSLPPRLRLWLCPEGLPDAEARHRFAATLAPRLLLLGPDLPAEDEPVDVIVAPGLALAGPGPAADAAAARVAAGCRPAVPPRLKVLTLGAGEGLLRVARDHGALAVLSEPALDTIAGWMSAVARGLAPAEALRRAGPGTQAWHGGSVPLVAAPVATLAPAAPAGAADGAPEPGAAADHRQITALSFDLVESTALLGRLGVEAYSELLTALQSRCTAAVESRGGSVEWRQGDDGSIAWFGLPHALEDAAVRAADAALDMLAACEALPGRPRLRIGIATGRVAVRRGLPYGTVLHLAARQRAIAEPGAVVVDDASARLAARRFEFTPLDWSQPLRGLSEAPRLALLARRSDGSVGAPPPSNRFVGREAELEELADRWERARRGAVVELLLHGEAGVGKTRLVREFLARVAGDGGRCVQTRGLPELQGQAFRTVADALRQQLGLRVGDSAEAQQEALARALPPLPGDGEAAATQALLAKLLGVATPAAEVAAHAAQQRSRLLETLPRVLAAWAEQAPLLLVVEDLQWIDPSSAELLPRLAAAAPAGRLMLLATCRDEDGATLPPMAAGVERLALQRLSPAASRWLIREIVGETLTPELIDRLARRGGGVPLFLEESARLALESGGDDPVIQVDSVADAAVPASLESLLTARLDRLPPRARALAQLAAVLGREFPQALLDAVAESPDLPPALADAATARERLERSGVLRRFDAGGQRWIGFGHELLRDVAYLSLWQRDRRQLHGVVADVLDDRFADAVAAQPDWLAHHLTEAGRLARAVALWERAARDAAAASAHREAIRHARAALASLRELPASRERDRIELRLQLLLGGRQIAAEGYGAAEVQRSYQRAGELVDSLEDARSRAKVHLGLEAVHVMRGELARAAEIAQRALEAAAGLGDALTLLQARWAVAHVHYHQGDAPRAVALMDECLADYDEALHRPEAVQDPAVMCLCYSAWALWELGRGQDAQARIERVLAMAQRLGHRFSQAEACGFAASVALFRGDSARGLPLAEQAVALCEESGFSAWLGHSRIVRGRLRALQGDATGGLAEMQAGYRLWTATGAAITRPFYLALMAETRLELGQPEEAQRLIDEARQLVARSGERYHEAELLRLGALAALALGRGAQASALAAQAAQRARAQGKHALLLRAAMAQLDVATAGTRTPDAAAVQALAVALQQLPQDDGGADLRRARALLARWGSAATAA